MVGLAEKAFGWGCFIALHGYLIASTYAVFYELCWALWNLGLGDFGLDKVHRGARVIAVLIWVVLGGVRLEWVTAWIVARLRSFRPKIRLSGRRIAMQSDPNAALGRLRPGFARDRSGRPRYCRMGQDCFDGGRPLADRVYHCSRINKKCIRDGKLRGIHIPVYDHYCSWIGVVVYLDTIKPYLLTLCFLCLDALVVFSCSVVALVWYPSTVVYAAMTVWSTIIVVCLASHNTVRQFKNLAMRNCTAPERQFQKRYPNGNIRKPFWFRVTLDNDYIDNRYTGSNPNPWDLGTRRNLHQVFGGWDCLLPWTQPARIADYGKPTLEFDFEMNDELRDWVTEKRRELRLRAAGSPPAVAPNEQREEVQSRGSPPAPQQSPPPVSPPIKIIPPLIPREISSRLSPIME